MNTRIDILTGDNSSSIYKKVENFYLEKVQVLFLFLHKKHWDFLAGIVITLLIEPHNALRAAYLMQKGLDRKRFTNLNPTILTKKQLEFSPVLLIHGDSSGSGIFGPIVEQLTKDCHHRPIFFIDLISPSGVVSAENHLKPVMARVKEIVALYPYAMPPKISCVGHSSGGDILGPLVKAMQEENLPLPKTIIKIGSIFKGAEALEFIHYLHGKVLEILGTNDIFEGCKSLSLIHISEPTRPY